MNENPRVFISYSHEQDKDYEQKLLRFSNKLRSEGIDASIDLYEEAPEEGWPRWMENQIRWADYVLVVASKSYYDKCYGSQKGKGVNWEVNIVYQNIYDNNAQTSKFIPVFFNEGDDQYILTPLKPFTYYDLSKDDQYDKLYWRLRGVSKNQKPPLGNLRPLDEKEQKSTMVYTSPIDLEKWNEAGWHGMIYLLQPGSIPALGLLFRNFDMGVKIFDEWRKCYKDKLDDYIEVSYVIPPFPDYCYVLKNKDTSYGNGYFIYIGPNMNASIMRSVKDGIKPFYMIGLSRNLWVDEQNGSKYREMFTAMAKGLGKYDLMPIGIKDSFKPLSQDNLIIGDEHFIELSKFTVETGIEVDKDRNNMHRSVLKPPVNPKDIGLV